MRNSRLPNVFSQSPALFILFILLYAVSQFANVRLELQASGANSYKAAAVSNRDIQGSGAVGSLAPAASDSLRVMTFNIRHGEGMDGRVNLSRVVLAIRAASPDLVALQEVDKYRLRSGLADQAGQLARSLHMYVVYFPSFTEWGFSQYGNALLSRYPVESAQVRRLPGGEEPRSVITARIRADGKEMTVIATHLGVAESDRKLQMPGLIGIIKETPAPRIVLGDFNMPSSHRLMQPLLALMREVKPAAPAATVIGGRTIDHIFTDGDESLPATVEPADASDHFPVIARIGL